MVTAGVVPSGVVTLDTVGSDVASGGSSFSYIFSHENSENVIIKQSKSARYFFILSSSTELKTCLAACHGLRSKNGG